MASNLFDFDFSGEKAAVSVAEPREYEIPQIKLSYVSSPKIRASETISTSDALRDAFRASYEDGMIEYREEIKVAYLSRSNKIIGIQTVGIGSDSASICDCKAVYVGALLCRANGIALCHNHPSGTLRPSIPDDKLTREIKEGANLLGLTFLDHLILTEDGCYSYHDEGRL